MLLDQLSIILTVHGATHNWQVPQLVVRFVDLCKSLLSSLLLLPDACLSSRQILSACRELEAALWPGDQLCRSCEFSLLS